MSSSSLEKLVRVGDTIRYRRDGEDREGVVASIDHCAIRNGKFGRKVREFRWSERDYCFLLLLDDGHCYGAELQ
jgi:hypothetical protein